MGRQLLQTSDLDLVHDKFTIILSGACEGQSCESCIAGNVCKDISLVVCILEEFYQRCSEIAFEAILANYQ